MRKGGKNLGCEICDSVIWGSFLYTSSIWNESRSRRVLGDFSIRLTFFMMCEMERACWNWKRFRGFPSFVRRDADGGIPGFTPSLLPFVSLFCDNSLPNPIYQSNSDNILSSITYIRWVGNPQIWLKQFPHFVQILVILLAWWGGLGVCLFCGCTGFNMSKVLINLQKSWFVCQYNVVVTSLSATK